MNRTAHAPMWLSSLFSSLFFLVLTTSVGCTELDVTRVTPTTAKDAPNPRIKPGNIAGYWDDVRFTHGEIATVLTYANHATLAQLDGAARLDLRAARSIVAAQPIASIGELSRLYFVGNETLKRLKAAALRAQVEQTVAAGQAPSSRPGSAT